MRDVLCHWGWKKKDAKYVKREWKNGRWQYYYPEDLMSERGSKYSGVTNTRTNFVDSVKSTETKHTVTREVEPAKKLEIKLGDTHIDWTYKKTETTPVKPYTITTKNIGKLEQTANNILSRLNSKTSIEYGVKTRKGNTGNTIDVRKSNKLLSSSKQNRLTGEVTIRNVGLIEQAVDKGKTWIDRYLR